MCTIEHKGAVGETLSGGEMANLKVVQRPTDVTDSQCISPFSSAEQLMLEKIVQSH